MLTLFSGIVEASPGDRVLKEGMSGEDVAYVQRLLAEQNFYQGDIDGIYGSGTVQAVTQFQIAVGLTPDGNAGQETINYLARHPSSASRSRRTLSMVASAYSAYDDGNGSRTYGGHLVHKGLVAVDPDVIPLGTRLYIEGYGYAVADDVGSAIQGNRIDLAFDSHAAAVQFGRQTVMVYIIE